MSRLFHARRNMQKRLLDLVDHPSRELLEELGLRPQAGGAGGDDEDEVGDAGAATPVARSRG